LKIQWNEKTGAPYRIFGQGIQPQKMKTALPTAISELGDIEVKFLSDNFISDNRDFFEINPKNLNLIKLEKFKDKWIVDYQQFYESIPVFGGHVGLTIDNESKIVLFGSNYYPNISITTTPQISKERYIELAKNEVIFNDTTDFIRNSSLIIFPIESDGKINYHLTWMVELFSVNPLGEWVFFIDATDGSLLFKYNRMKSSTINGYVSGVMYPQKPSQGLYSTYFKYETVKITQGSSLKGTNNTNINGYYEISGLPSGYYNIISKLNGTYVEVNNDEQTPAQYTYNNIYVPNSLNWNWYNYDSSDSYEESNVFYHVNKIHDFFKNTLGYNGMDYQIDATVSDSFINNYYGGCNAMGGRYSISFGHGDWFTCNNLALFSDVIYHEYTHSVVDNIYYYLPYYDQSGAMNEGWADYFAASVNNDSVMMDGMCKLFGCWIPSLGPGDRNVDNIKKYPDDWVGEVHSDGMIFSGVLWDVRKKLGASKTDSLALEAMQITPQAYTFSEYLDNVLIADDDNGDLSDGTPNMGYICEAFTRHGINSINCIDYCRPRIVSYPSSIKVIQAGIITWFNPCESSHTSIHYCTSGYICDPSTNTFEYNTNTKSDLPAKYNDSIYFDKVGNWEFFIHTVSQGDDHFSDKRSIQVLENIPPSWYSVKTSPTLPANYSFSVTYQFNVSWADNAGISTVIAEHNFYGSLQNITIYSKQGNEYFFNIYNLNAGNYLWREYAQDINDNWAVTPQWNYIINKAPSDSFLHLELQGNESNQTITYGTTSTARGWKTIWEGPLKLLRNGTVASEISVGTYSLYDTQTLNTSVYNYTLFFPGSGNYLSSSLTRFLNITKLPPNLTLQINYGTFNTNSSINYGTQTVVYAYSSNPDIFYLYRNGMLVASGSTPLYYYENLPAGYYNFTTYFSGSNNYEPTVQTNFQNISKYPTVSSLQLNYQSNNLTITYGTQSQAQANTNIGSVTLLRDGILVANPDINILPAGIYNYTAVNHGNENISESKITYFLTVVKGTPALSLLSNVSWSTTYEIATSTSGSGCPTQGAQDVTCNLYRNDAGLVSNPNNLLLSAGLYNYTYNSSGGQNWTSASVSNILTVNKKNANVRAYPTTQTLTYPVTVMQYCMDDSNFYVCIIYRNDSLMTNGTQYSPAAGVYSYTANITDTMNYTNYQATSTLVINPIVVTVNLYLNHVQDNKTLTYGIQSRAEAITNYGSVTLYRDGTPVTNPEIAVLPVPYKPYNYTAVSEFYENKNYSGVLSKTLFLTVNKPLPGLSLKLNGTEGNVNYIYSSAVKAQGTLSSGDSITHLYRNGVEVSNPDENLLGVGYYNYTFFYEESQNYSSGSITRFATVNPGIVTLFMALNGTQSDRTYKYSDIINVTAWKTPTLNDEGIITLFRNGSQITNPDLWIPDPGVYNYTAVLQSSNYTVNPIQRIVIVNKGNSSVHLFLNSNDGDIKFEKGDIINITSIMSIPGKIINLYLDEKLIGSGSSPFEFHLSTDELSLDDHIIKSSWSGDDKYLGSEESHILKSSIVTLCEKNTINCALSCNNCPSSGYEYCEYSWIPKSITGCTPTRYGKLQPGESIPWLTCSSGGACILKGKLLSITTSSSTSTTTTTQTTTTTTTTVPTTTTIPTTTTTIPGSTTTTIPITTTTVPTTCSPCTLACAIKLNNCYNGYYRQHWCSGYSLKYSESCTNYCCNFIGGNCNNGVCLGYSTTTTLTTTTTSTTSTTIPGSTTTTTTLPTTTTTLPTTTTTISGGTILYQVSSGCQLYSGLSCPSSGYSRCEVQLDSAPCSYCNCPTTVTLQPGRNYKFTTFCPYTTLSTGCKMTGFV
jgi:Zn-dependent metalloprotease